MRDASGCRASLQRRLESVWYRASRPPRSLTLLSQAFGALVNARQHAYLRGWRAVKRAGRPVVVVGNLSVGGSGKTPLVVWLAQQLRRSGARVGVVLRGYGGSGGRSPQPVMPGSDSAEVGDEALLIRLRADCPVAVGRDRVGAARLLIEQGSELIIADDGLQHLRLARDCEIAVIDALRGLGNGMLLPAGPLREPRARLASVDAVVINGEGGFEYPGAVHMRLVGETLLPLSGTSEPVPLARLAGRRVHAVAGIAHPQRFFAQLRSAGLVPIEHAFPDHHVYRGGELEFHDALPVLMTEKDAVKCHVFGGAGRWYLPVSAQLAPRDAETLLARVRDCLGMREGASA